MFSRNAEALRRTDTVTLVQLQFLYAISFYHNLCGENIFNIKSWLCPYTNTLKHHSHPHAFRFKLLRVKWRWHRGIGQWLPKTTGYQRRANLLWFWKTYQMAHHQCKGQTISGVRQQRRWRDALSMNEPRQIGLVEKILWRMKKGDRGSGKKWQMKNMKKLDIILIWWRAIQALVWKIERKSKMKYTKRGKRNWKNWLTKRTTFRR